MAHDPTEPDTADDLESETSASEIDVEAPEVDAAEQQADISPEGDDPLEGVDQDRGNVADLVEQARVVRLDEDDYR